MFANVIAILIGEFAKLEAQALDEAIQSVRNFLDTYARHKEGPAAMLEEHRKVCAQYPTYAEFAALHPHLFPK